MGKSHSGPGEVPNRSYGWIVENLIRSVGPHDSLSLLHCSSRRAVHSSTCKGLKNMHQSCKGHRPFSHLTPPASNRAVPSGRVPCSASCLSWNGLSLCPTCAAARSGQLARPFSRKWQADDGEAWTMDNFRPNGSRAVEATFPSQPHLNTMGTADLPYSRKNKCTVLPRDHRREPRVVFPMNQSRA